eukprot:GHVS01024069.1.p1 GENE.GHVS01024069.1~~GHVS01024069.1.p1  ORF type:complete len:399 (+),score=54.71 GHVS01024069.1:147-1343(+)
MTRSCLLAFMLIVGCVSAEVVEKLRGAKPEVVGNAADKVEAEQMMQRAAEALAEIAKKIEAASEMERPEGARATFAEGTVNQEEVVKLGRDVDVVESAVGGELVDDVEDLFQADILHDVVEAAEVEEEGLVTAAPVVEDSEIVYTAAVDEETAVTNRRRLQAIHEHETSNDRVVRKGHLHVDSEGRLVRSSVHHDDGKKSIGVALVELITGKDRAKLTENRDRDTFASKSSGDDESRSHSDAGVEQILVKHVIVSKNEPRVEKDQETESSDSSEEESDESSVSSESSDSSTKEGQRGPHQMTVENIQSDRSCFECDIDYYDFDVKKIENGITSITDCQKLCQDHSMCDFFTFVESWGGCYLKHSRKGRIAETTNVLVSGVKYCNNSGSIQCHGHTFTW